MLKSSQPFNYLKPILCCIGIWLISFTSYSASNINISAMSNTDIDEQLAYIDSIRISNPKEANELLDQLNKDKALLNEDLFNKLQLQNALRHAFSGDFAKSLHQIEQLLDDNPSNLVKIRAIALKVNVALINQNWQFGLDNLSRLFKESEQHNNIQYDEIIFVVAAQFYNRLNQNKLTIEFASKATQLNLTPRGQCIAERTLIEANLKLGELLALDPKVQRAINICKKNKMFVYSGLIMTLIARMHNDDDKPNAALGQLIPHLRDIENTNYANLIAEVYSAMAQAYWQKLNIERAERFALKAVEVGSHIASTEPMVNTYQLLYKIEKQKGNIDAALHYHELYAEADKRYLDELSAKSTAFQLAQHKASQQQSEIALLNQQNEILNNHNALLNIEQKITQKDADNTRTMVSLLLVIVALLTLFGYRSWRIQRRLKKLAQHDFLTKIHNRGYFMSQAKKMLMQAEKANQVVTCIIFDLDKFKSINDSFGHTAGDWVLEAVASRIKACIRQQDLFARLGGEEFIILLPNCDTQAASYVADKCAKQLTTIDSVETGHQFAISASFGVSNTSLSGYEMTKLISNTDDAMYKAKVGGRNQVFYHQHATDKQQLPLQLN